MHATRTPHLRPAPEPDPQLAPRVLITIEDPLARRAVEGALRAQGFSVRATTDQAAAEVLLRSYEPEILVVDPHHMVPTLSPLLQRARRNEELYLVVHGADDTTRVGTLRNGADEALSAECHPDEIAVRCEVLLRRPKRRRPRWDPLGSNEVRLGPLSVDLGRREIQVNGHVVAATRLEFDLFAQLCRHPQEVRSRAQLLEAVWGPGWVGDTHVVDVHLSNLRRKLRQRANDLQFIHTVRGVGFRLSDDLLRLALPEMAESGNNVHSLMA